MTFIFILLFCFLFSFFYFLFVRQFVNSPFMGDPVSGWNMPYNLIIIGIPCFFGGLLVFGLPRVLVTRHMFHILQGDHKTAIEHHFHKSQISMSDLKGK